MAQISVVQFASELGLPPALLLEQLQAAGVKRALGKAPVLTETDKAQLLDYLRQSHGATQPKTRITLTRRQTTEIKKADSTGKARTIQVEVRKKRVFVKRDPSAAEPAVVEPAVPIIDQDQQARREEDARRQAELSARQAEEVRAKHALRSAKAQAAEPAPAPEEPAQEAPADVQAEKAPASANEVQEPVAQAPAAAQPPADSTLHKPSVKPEDQAAKPKKESAKKPVVWQDEGAKRRTIKTRGDATGGLGWRERKDRTARAKEDEATRHAFSAPTEPIVREVVVPETITVAALAQKMSIKAAEVIKKLMKLGSMVTINQVLDQDAAMIVVEELGHVAKRAKLDDPDSFLAETPSDHEPTKLEQR